MLVKRRGRGFPRPGTPLCPAYVYQIGLWEGRPPLWLLLGTQKCGGRALCSSPKASAARRALSVNPFPEEDAGLRAVWGHVAHARPRSRVSGVWSRNKTGHMHSS